LGLVTGGRFHDRIHVHGGGALLGNLPAGVRLHLNAGLISNFLTGFRLYLNAGLVIFFMMLSEAESQEKRCSCALQPGHIRSKCHFNSVWFHWNDENDPFGYHAPDFSFKKAKLRPNIIIIDILRAACVFIAFTFPQPSENEVWSFSDAKESFPAYKCSMIALSDT
jgi:hypothetical protein